MNLFDKNIVRSVEQKKLTVPAKYSSQFHSSLLLLVKSSVGGSSSALKVPGKLKTIVQIHKYQQSNILQRFRQTLCKDNVKDD